MNEEEENNELEGGTYPQFTNSPNRTRRQNENRGVSGFPTIDR